ncbi:Ppx/GppA phosphatase family-domain-containing protein [Lipomyces arxii]|uniref:Ppx/GppA phosphatase family-domain-containing protein n=1 Tax=Lipomyces arxii TaxID=56418 RepID=UPI0034CD29CA
MLIAVIDIGSNAVRFVVTDQTDSDAARNLPVVFQDRARISIFDALASSKDKRISSSVMSKLRVSIERFDKICRSLRVPDENVTVFGTEASRTASNAPELLNMIQDINAHWDVSLLSPRKEATYGAMGIAASYYEVNGIFMDLGGGSIQISWVSSVGGTFRMSDSAVSLPFGAAALSQSMRMMKMNDLRSQIASAFHSAFKTIKLPFPLKGANLYLSGGGFRGLGCLAMSVLSDDEYYPVPIINGYCCTLRDVEKVSQMQVNDKMSDKLEDVFRISKRRASQLPGVLILTQALIQTAPNLGSIYFCQGGIKEGFLYSQLEDDVRRKDPLVTCTIISAKPACAKIFDLMVYAMSSFTPMYISKRILPAAVNLLYYHSSYTKDVQATSALTIAVSGALSGTFGLSHVDRALLGIVLCERWGGEVFDERVLGRLCELVVSETKSGQGLAYMFWSYYISKLSAVLVDLFPAGVVDDPGRVSIKLLTDEPDLVVVELTLVKDDPFVVSSWDRIESLEKKVNKFKKKYSISNVPRMQFKLHLE